MNAAIGLLIYNRPEHTARVLAAIAAAKPRKLMVVADGPRTSDAADAERCAATRQVVENFDWECEVLADYSSEHLGMGRREATGMDWFFAQEDRVIILEDDTLPHPTFFRYCDELLERYADDERIFVISGDNHHQTHRRTDYSYSFSRQPLTWGWASWRRAWRHYDFSMSVWPELKTAGWLRDILQNRDAIRYWTRIFNDTYAGLVDTWDYQWVLACWAQHALTIVPSVNLISNIGFGAGATNTVDGSHPLAGSRTSELRFPLRHPPFVIRDSIADDLDALMLFSPGLRGRVKRVARRIFASGQST